MRVLVFVLGMCCGSFVNMLVYRTAIKYKILKPAIKGLGLRSGCDFCGKRLGWYENVPLVSWLIQRGKSRCCGKKLSVAYPMVEAGMGLLFWISFSQQWPILNYRSVMVLFFSLIVVTFLMFSTVFDVEYMVLPDFSTGILVGVAVILLALQGQVFYLGQYLLAMGVGVGFLLVLHLATKGKGMGMGDVKLAAFMGMFLGWPGIIVAFYVAFIAGAIVGGWLMFFGKLKRKSIICFGPFLILGTLVSWWGGDGLISSFKFLIYN